MMADNKQNHKNRQNRGNRERDNDRVEEFAEQAFRLLGRRLTKGQALTELGKMLRERFGDRTDDVLDALSLASPFIGTANLFQPLAQRLTKRRLAGNLTSEMLEGALTGVIDSLRLGAQDSLALMAMNETEQKEHWNKVLMTALEKAGDAPSDKDKKAMDIKDNKDKPVSKPKGFQDAYGAVIRALADKKNLELQQKFEERYQKIVEATEADADLLVAAAAADVSENDVYAILTVVNDDARLKTFKALVKGRKAPETKAESAVQFVKNIANAASVSEHAEKFQEKLDDSSQETQLDREHLHGLNKAVDEAKSKESFGFFGFLWWLITFQWLSSRR